MNDHDVVIAGGGPTGLMLACELRIAELDVLVVERRTRHDLQEPRARGLHARSLEILDQRGVGDRFVAAGQIHPQIGFAGIPLDLSDLPTRHNYVLGLVQPEVERLLVEWAGELGVPIRRGTEVSSISLDSDGVDITSSDGASLRAAYLVGCDGGRSQVRKSAGIAFHGMDASTSWVMAEVEMTEEPPIGMHPEGGGIAPANPLAPDGRFGVVVTEFPAQLGDATLDDVRSALTKTYGTDFGAHSPRWVSRFTDMARQAAAYRNGRVLLAGDAAHVHPPQGGQGLNTGLQDAVNLGWKLAQVVRGISPARLLDTYHAERHPVAARVLHNTSAQVALSAPGDRQQALRDTMTELLSMDEPRQHLAAMLTALDVRYDCGEGHPLRGLRMPDLDVNTADGPARVAALLHDGRGVLLHLSAPRGSDLAGRRPRVRELHARITGDIVLPLIGTVPAPASVLIRPDGHVAWAGSPADPGLQTALDDWFGVGGA